MKLGVVIVLTLLFGSVAAHFLLENNGYVLINFLGYTVEMSVPVLFALFCIGYLIVRLVVRIWKAPKALGEIAARARSERSSRQVTKGFIALSEGKLSRGERLLTKGAAHSETPLLNYLAAARTAQMQGDPERRDGWLKMAYEHGDGASNAVLLTQAELQLASGELEQARASLQRIREDQPKHPQALRLLAELHLQEHNWEGLMALLPDLRRTKHIPRKQLDAWVVEAYQHLFSRPDIDRTAIDSHWQNLPKPARKLPELVRARITALITCGETTIADTEIRAALKANWHDPLVEAYGALDLTDKDKQLRQIETWLTERPENPVLLLAAGRTCMRGQLWGKARSYLESSLAIKPSSTAFHELGKLMLTLDDHDAATNAFARGLTLSHGEGTATPLLTSQPAD
jgi:HemY protein